MKMIQTVAWFMLMTLGLNYSVATSEGTRLGQNTNRGKNIYHDGWTDLNKNGKMDVYENPVVEPGKFKVMIGSGSEAIRLNGQFEILPAS